MLQYWANSASNCGLQILHFTFSVLPSLNSSPFPQGLVLFKILFSDGESCSVRIQLYFFDLYSGPWFFWLVFECLWVFSGVLQWINQSKCLDSEDEEVQWMGVGSRAIWHCNKIPFIELCTQWAKHCISGFWNISLSTSYARHVLLYFNQWRNYASKRIHNFPDLGMQLDMLDSRRCPGLIVELPVLIPCSISPWILFP